jgi:tetratricopeptide (TPR) repeat protein
MTLNLTVTTGRCIYQSADFRLLDWTTGKLTDFETQKIVLVNRFRWTATICFAGVGRTRKVNVGDWLAERVAAIQQDDPFDRLLDELLTADEWLSDVPPEHKHHSFSVGAFVGIVPVFALVSNFETLSGPPAAEAKARLAVTRLQPDKPNTFVAGQTHAVSRAQRRQLATLAGRNPEPKPVLDAMAEVNRSVAAQNNKVSEACFTTYVRITGEGGGFAHGIGSVPFSPAFGMPSVIQGELKQFLDERFGPGKAQLRQFATGRSEATDEYHETQLREKPRDASTHSNYGAFLKDKKGDSERAEQAYRKALELDSRHVNALGNLANLMWEKGNKDQAESLYRQALETSPQDENVTYNFARFLHNERGDRTTALTLLDGGINANPNSGRLLLLKGELSLLDGNASQALECYRRARDKGADQAQVECGFACALHISGAPIGDCLGAYRVAIGLNPQNASLKLNLAQLLFIKADDSQATKQLQEAMRIGLDESSQLEAQFYQLAHTSVESAAILLATDECLSHGARLQWNVQANIEKVKEVHPEKAALLETVRKVMAGEQDRSALVEILADWPSGLKP